MSSSLHHITLELFLTRGMNMSSTARKTDAPSSSKGVSKRSGKSQRDILDYFPGTPRPGQASLLRQLQESWDKADVFVLNAPVAFGKTLVGMTIARWAGKAHVALPNNMLVQQMKESFPQVACLERKDSYRCHSYRDEVDLSYANCSSHKNRTNEYCTGCPYLAATRAAYARPVSVSNYHIYMSYKIYKPTVIIDEAHLMVPLIQDLEGRKVWAQDIGLPQSIDTYTKLRDWLKKNPQVVEPRPALQTLLADLETGTEHYLVKRGEERWRNEERDCLSLLPIDTAHSQKAVMLWPQQKVKKLVLMSATLSEMDVRQLALQGRRVKYIYGESPIPKERRPILWNNGLESNVRFPYTSEGMQDLTNSIVDMVKTNDYIRTTKGLIHAPYSQAVVLGKVLKQLLPTHTILVHDARNKQQVFEQFKASNKSCILIGSGMWEGLDLLGYEYGWQAIAKLPFPSLGDAAWSYLAEHEPERYAWATAKTLLQGFGRICRGPTDFGLTIVLDKAFDNFYFRQASLFPPYIREAIEHGKGLQLETAVRKRDEG